MGLVPGRFPCPDAPDVYLVHGWPEKPIGFRAFRAQDSGFRVQGLGPLEVQCEPSTLNISWER